MYRLDIAQRYKSSSMLWSMRDTIIWRARQRCFDCPAARRGPYSMPAIRVRGSPLRLLLKDLRHVSSLHQLVRYFSSTLRKKFLACTGQTRDSSDGFFKLSAIRLRGTKVGEPVHVPCA